MELQTGEVVQRRGIIYYCGVSSPPYTRKDRCHNQAVVRLDDDYWHIYQNYRIRYNKMRRCHCHADLPVIIQPYLCAGHLKDLQDLNDDPREALRHD